jgi:16S rRNA (uracil1498-N3)-methyltransferase
VAHFYLSEQVTAAEEGGTVRLSGDEGRHAALVSRLRVGERTRIGDGRGRIAEAEAVAVAKDSVELRVLEVRTEPRPAPRILLVQALAKGGRDELAIQAATELGVAAVAPWQAARSVTRWTGPKAASGAARWGGIVREAGKQAMRAWAPGALPLHSTADVASLARTRFTVVLEPGVGDRLVDVVPAEVPGGELALVVGPEGGIAPEELEAFTAAGAVLARLGPTVLRTSTAGPAALAALAVHLDLWP